MILTCDIHLSMGATAKFVRGRLHAQHRTSSKDTDDICHVQEESNWESEERALGAECKRRSEIHLNFSHQKSLSYKQNGINTVFSTEINAYIKKTLFITSA